MEKYLPSKKFSIRLAIVTIIILVIFGGYKLVTLIKNKVFTKTPTKLLIKDLIQKDTNKNGIPDWEESLWGLDPNNNGESNKAFIMAKRASLSGGEDDYIIKGNTPSKENTQLSKDFFAAIVTLQQTGNLTDESIDTVSKTIGQKIIPAPIPDTYKKDNLKIVTTNDKNTLAYLDAFKKLDTKYSDKDIGNELTFIAIGLKNNDAQAVSVVGSIVSSYHSYGEDLMKIPTPESIASYNINLANDYEKVSLSITDLMQILSDPMIGMKGLINYKKYSDALVNDLQNISDNIE